uniref:C2H2-type domain-containing protein n=1 Tax=Globodera rostochiensis TaxID=31243 RepID=A0A914HYL7_GLORO
MKCTKLSERLESDENILERLKLKERKKCHELLLELLLPPIRQLMGPRPIGTTNSVSSSCFSSPSLITSHSFHSAAGSESFPLKPLKSNGGLRMGKGQGKQKQHQQTAHKCEQCQKAFRFKSNLFEHKSLHLGSSSRNPFVCPFCSKTCRLKGNLKKHLQVHVTSAEDLECLWKRSFSRNSGRPRKGLPHVPLPKPGDDLGLVPVNIQQQRVRYNQMGPPAAEQSV